MHVRQAKIISAEAFARVDQCLVGSRFALRDRAMLDLPYTTGMRTGELAALNVGDVFHHGRVANQLKIGTDETKYTDVISLPRDLGGLAPSMPMRDVVAYKGVESGERFHLF